MRRRRGVGRGRLGDTCVWRGGLGIPGGLAGGVVVVLLAARRRGIDVRVMLDIAAPAVALAQAIGSGGEGTLDLDEPVVGSERTEVS